MSILYPKMSKRILSSHKIPKKYNEWRCSIKTAVLKISQYWPRKYPCLNFFLNKNTCLWCCNFRQYCEIFHNSCFEEILRTASSKTFSFYVSLNVFLHEQITQQASKKVKKMFFQKQNKKYRSKNQLDVKKSCLSWCSL